MDAFLGTGWPLPVQPDDSGRLRYAPPSAERVAQSIYLIVMTRPGERVMRPDFGCAIHEDIGRDNTEVRRRQIAERVRMAVTQWEPRVEVLEVQVAEVSETAIQLGLRFLIRSTNSYYNLVFPYFLEEGRDAAASSAT